jgi:hypothetical protein
LFLHRSLTIHLCLAFPARRFFGKVCRSCAVN